jgi:hypothetical protein
MSYQFFKKHVLPATEALVPKSFYIISAENSTKAALHYVDATGNVRSFLNEERVEEMIASLGTSAPLRIVPTNVERDALALEQDTLVVVENVQGAEAFPALYLYIHSLSLFVPLSGEHSHSNLPTLQELGEDGEGHLTYRGQRVATVVLATSTW